MRDGDALMRRISLDGLRTFDLAARLMSFTAAANALCVTQSAISQRIRLLEQQLDIRLFERGPHALSLTPEGERLAEEVRDAMDRIVGALGALTGEMNPGPLAVSAPAAFVARWLIPRLGRFAQQAPDIEVRLLTETAEGGAFDLGIRFGNGQWPGLSATRLMGDVMLPVCNPALLRAHGRIERMDALSSLPLLHDTSADAASGGADWKSWTAAAGAPGLRLGAGPRFGEASLVMEAASRGLGIALARLSLAGDDLLAGRLVRLPLPCVATTQAHYLVCPPDQLARMRPARMRLWLLQEAIDFERRMTGLIERPA